MIGPEDDIDAIVAQEDHASGNISDDDESDDDEEIEEALPPDAPENEWILAKHQYRVVSPSMDKLMQLTGLRVVKVY